MVLPNQRERRQWHPSASRQIARRFVIEGTLVLDTPASISNGETNGTEIVILEDELERRPLLPGASLAGALRHYILTREVGYGVGDTRLRDESDNDYKARLRNRMATQLFGESLDLDTERMESRVIVHDALGAPDSVLTRREGVKIDGATRTAEEGMLFSAQVWEVGTQFSLRLELVLYDGDGDELAIALAAGLQALGAGDIPMGGRKNRGYGRAHVEAWQVQYYDMAQPQALVAWLNDMPAHDATETFFDSANEFSDNRQYVHVEAYLRLTDSLLIRAMSDVADHEHLTSNDQPVLSGTSVAGALRARGLKIANAISDGNGQALVDDMFGKHGNDGDDDLTASRLLVEEHPLENGEFQMIQNRVKIDRFTGGAFETALFDQRPVFADGDTIVRIGMTLRYPEGENTTLLDAQTGLLLLLVKDLWTEDLALGGEASVGRGRLQGMKADIKVHLVKDFPAFNFSLNQDGLTADSANARLNLETFVQALWQTLGGTA